MSMHKPKSPLGYQFIMNTSYNSSIMNTDIQMCKVSGYDIEQQIEEAKLNFIFK